MSVVGRVVGAAAAVGGVLGAAVLGGATAHRATVAKYRQLGRELTVDDGGDAAADTPDRVYSVDTDDGVALHVEEIGPVDADVTVVLAHGWTLNLASWHFQRRDLARLGGLRLVLYDQRCHGRSSTGAVPGTNLARLGADLRAVLDTAAPTGRLLLAGHSMGAMAILALAAADPAFVADRVAGVALLSASASAAADPAHREAASVGIARWRQVNGTNPALPYLAAVAARYPRVAERLRGAAHDAVWLATRTLGFASDVPAPLVDRLDEMISATPIEVITDFAPALFAHDVRAGLPVLAGTETLLLVGDADRMTPPSASRAMATALPDATLVVVPQAGHMVVLERWRAVATALREWVGRAVGDVIDIPAGSAETDRAERRAVRR